MYYLWGFIGLEGGKYAAMLSRKNPRKQLSLQYKDWRPSLVDFRTGGEAVKHGRRLINRYKRLKAATCR